MINIDIAVPILDKEYNFNLDEETKISALINEISELIAKKEHLNLSGAKSSMIIGSLDKKINLNFDFCLREYRIRTGEKLILV